MESPTFDESIFKKERNIYKKVKPTIDKEKVKDIPGMKELWKSIEQFQDLLDQNLGKKPFKEGTKKLSQRQLYQLKHQLIQLKTQQYYLADSVSQTLFTKKNQGSFFRDSIESQANYLVLPRGYMNGSNDIEFKEPRKSTLPAAALISDEDLEVIIKEKKPYLDFRNKNHLYHLIQNYWDIAESVREIPDSPLWGILETLDFYIEKANLSKQQLLIIRDKKLRIPNKDIAKHLMDELGIYHQENYVSTIWNKSLKLIAAAAELNYDEFLSKDYDKAWKNCIRCGKEFLRDERNFIRKSKASDGLSNICKCCEKKSRNRS